MQGSLALRNGVLYVGREEKTAHVRAFDLDGRYLDVGFSFRDADQSRAAAAGIAVDGDHRIWVADTPSGSLRCFTLFGAEVSRWPRNEPALPRPAHSARAHASNDRRGCLAGIVDVEVQGDTDALLVWAALEGPERRHAVQALAPDGTVVDSLRPQGDPQGVFRNVRRIAALDRNLYVCESGANRVQVFRDGQFHFLFRAPEPRQGTWILRACAPLPDGRAILGLSGEQSALVLVDPCGRPLRWLATHGEGGGYVFQPNDLAVESSELDRHTRVFAIDRDAERVQVFSLEGGCHGAFEDLAV